MNIVKRAFWGCYYRIIYPLYNHTVKTYQTEKQVKKKYFIQKGSRNIVILGTPNHGNLGDYAIYVAERELFSKYVPSCHVFAVNMTDFQHEIDALKHLLTEKDILVLTGGGNLGNQYMDDEIIRRKTIEMFPKNQIVIFPQTMYFTNDAAGEKEKKETAAIYNRHEHLCITARDQKTFADMKDLFCGKVNLLPDVVLTMERTGHNTAREGALLLLRNDVEKKLSEEQVNYLLQLLSIRFEKVVRTDTEIEIKDPSVMEEELKKKLLQIMGAQLVITDRLHGMIFAAITHTPCLVLDNYNHKVKETYKWINHLDYVQYISDLEQVSQSIDNLMQIRTCIFESESIQKLYEKFIQEIISG